jgi:hypothetical protein
MIHDDFPEESQTGQSNRPRPVRLPEPALIEHQPVALLVPPVPGGDQ